jgi:SAM-dependent methyltransferase
VTAGGGHGKQGGGRLPSAVQWAHDVLAARLAPGDWALDATAGNGHDTLFLSRKVLPGGRVFAIDIQERALEETRRRLLEAGGANELDDSVTLLHGGHEGMCGLLPPEARGRLAAVMFNLGYLPGGDKSRVTQPDSTLRALDAAAAWMMPGGLMTVVVYPGHAGGDEEADAAEGWMAGISAGGWQVQHLRALHPSARPPECWFARKDMAAAGAGGQSMPLNQKG